MISLHRLLFFGQARCSRYQNSAIDGSVWHGPSRVAAGAAHDFSTFLCIWRSSANLEGKSSNIVLSPTTDPFNSFSPDTVMDFYSPPPPDPFNSIQDIASSYGKQENVTAIIGTVVTVLVVVLILIAVIMRLSKKKAAHNDIDNSLGVPTHRRTYAMEQLANPSGHPMEVDILDLNTHIVEELNYLEDGIDICTYTREELVKATDNFTTKVGQGVSGFVYRANLPGNRMGAVKRAINLDPNLFKQELSVLLRLPRHPHLVDLIGLCLQAGERILVFEFVSNGSLYDRLHTERGLASPSSWAARMNITCQVALALQYLHEEAKPPILHRDVKSANVLLVDDNFAKLADFGLSKLGPKNNQFTITAVRGSYGYMDPQYVKTRRFSTKSDVYSFGVLLLELITGLKSLHEDTPLAEWTQTCRLSEGIDIFMTIVDRNLIDHIDTMELQNMIKIANLCLLDISGERPSMTEIVNMIQDTRNINATANGNLSDGGEAGKWKLV